MLQDTIDNGDGTKTWHWSLQQAVPTYLASVATGNYVLYSDEYEGMEETIPITIYTRPSESSKVAGSFVNLKTVLAWFENRFGPYPFGRVGYTGTAIGAMEHATNIAYPHSSINGNTASESLYVHELSHMWFGDKVTCSTAEDMWLNEGWATFCAMMYVSDLYSHEQFLDMLRHEQREVLRKTHITDGGYFALNDIPQVVTYGSHAYDKGGQVTNTLRGYLGDSVFYEVMTAYLDNFAFESVASEDMRDFITDYTGIDMNGFFDAWVFTPGTPHFSIDSVGVVENGATFAADIWLKQKYKGADFLADDNILEVTFADDNFNYYTDTVHFSGKYGHSTKAIPFSPSAVFLDFYEKIGDATTDNYEYFTSPQEYKYPEAYFKLTIDQLTDSALVRVGHHWVAADSLKIPVPGLTLSPSRYWKIEGILPSGFQARGRFSYDQGNYLDNELITSQNDSVVILYREHTADEWSDPIQTRLGTWDFGYIDIEDLKLGEYTLAVWDKQIVGEKEIEFENEIKLFPNPTNGVLNIEFSEKGEYELMLYDSVGMKIEQITVKGKSKKWKFSKPQKPSGVYFVHIMEDNKLLTIKKVVFIK
jgi:aminopeptidase N